jgi:putative tricarboxylic transport membrane protein
MLAGAAMVGSAIVILNDTRKKSTPTRPRGAPTQFFKVVAPRHILVFAAMAAAYMLALQPLGFLLSTFIFLSASILYLHRKGLFLTLALSAGSLAAIYVVFRLLFTVVLPQGDIFR